MCFLIKLCKFKKLVEDCRVATHLCTRCFADLGEDEAFARRELERMGESVPKILCRSFNNRDCGNYVRVCFKMCEPMQYNIYKCIGCKCLEFDKDTEMDRLHMLTGYKIDEGEEVYDVDGKRRLAMVNDDNVKSRGVPNQQGSPSKPYPDYQSGKDPNYNYNNDNYGKPYAQPRGHQHQPHPDYHDYNPKYSQHPSNSRPSPQANDGRPSHPPSHQGSRQMSRRGSNASRQMSRRGSEQHSHFSKNSAPRPPPPKTHREPHRDSPHQKTNSYHPSQHSHALRAN